MDMELKLCYLGATIVRGLNIKKEFMENCKQQMEDLTKGNYLMMAEKQILR